jgi:Ring hydroxylating alpha subunit (catalytic domain)
MVADQDTDNLRRIQKGLKASRKPGVTLARYQESRIRHFHATLDAYLAI